MSICTDSIHGRLHILHGCLLLGKADSPRYIGCPENLQHNPMPSDSEIGSIVFSRVQLPDIGTGCHGKW